MARTMTAMVGTAGVTYCSRDGTPYRCDDTGIVHIDTAKVAEMQARGLSTAIAAHVTGNRHKGEALVVTVENS